ncbi:conserved hypothetical protein [Ricinus communis]|uniref:Uncharacterized protein n=1 Tax=Ricinus communis TaxID=3988 RepID=B9TKG1_RICCO|nr:conserved hypothetical protein [Ricinus communis]
MSALAPEGHAGKHAVAQNPRMQQGGAKVSDHQGEKQPGQNAMGVSEDRIEGGIGRKYRRRLPTAAHANWPAPGRSHRPADQGDSDHQRIKRPVEEAGQDLLEARDGPREGRRAEAQAVGQADASQQKERQSERLVQVEQRRAPGQGRHHPHADEQHRNQRGRHHPVQKAGKAIEARGGRRCVSTSVHCAAPFPTASVALP